MTSPYIKRRKRKVGDTCQFDDFNEDPVVGRGGHQLEEQRGQGKVVFGVAPGQLTDDVDCCRLDTCEIKHVLDNKGGPQQAGYSVCRAPACTWCYAQTANPLGP